MANAWSRILSFEDLRVPGGLGNHLQNSWVPCRLMLSLVLLCPKATVRSPHPILFCSIHFYYICFS